MPFSTSKQSPLPSYTPPRSGMSTPSRFANAAPSMPTSGAIAEKLALSYGRGSSLGRTGLTRRIMDCFAGLRIPVGGGSRPGPRREIVIPVLAFLHPARQSAGAHGSSLHPSVKRRDSSAPHSITSAAGAPIGRIVFAVVGTMVCIFFVVSMAFSLILKPGIKFLRKPRSLPFTEPSTVVLSPEELERIWRWEIASGHYPSRRPAGTDLGSHYFPGDVSGSASTAQKIENPGLPKRTEEDIRREREVQAEVVRRLRDQGAAGSRHQDNLAAAEIVPVGPARTYQDLPLGAKSRAYSQPYDVRYPPRPTLGAALDLDAVMDHCDFATNRYVRDCLEVLRINGGLTSPMLRRGDLEAWRTTFVNSGSGGGAASTRTRETLERYRNDMSTLLHNATSATFASLLASRQQLTLSGSSGHLGPHSSHPNADPACDPDYPHLFHIFWAGPFTDKPYAAALSFLYTQRLALSRPVKARAPKDVCRPQLWIWINPGPASSLPDKNAVRKMRADLAANPWSAPLLHKRFSEAVQFKLWNTTEQLDGVSEMAGWREMRLFNSGGVKYGVSSGTRLYSAESISG